MKIFDLETARTVISQVLAAKDIWIFGSRRRCPVVDPVNVVADSCVNVGFLGSLAVGGAVAHPSDPDGEPLPRVFSVVDHRPTVIALYDLKYMQLHLAILL